MKAKLSKTQALQVAVNAINASVPVGMGMLHFEPKDYSIEEVEDAMDEDGNIFIDYFHGRMVKLDLIVDCKSIDGGYILPSTDPHPEYQSWCKKYPTYQDLVESVLNSILT